MARLRQLSRNNPLIRRARRHAAVSVLFRAPEEGAAAFALPGTPLDPSVPLVQATWVVLDAELPWPPAAEVGETAAPAEAMASTVERATAVSPLARPTAPPTIEPRQAITPRAPAVPPVPIARSVSPPTAPLPVGEVAPAALPTERPAAAATPPAPSPPTGDDDPIWRRLQNIMRQHQEKQVQEGTSAATTEGESPRPPAAAPLPSGPPARPQSQLSLQPQSNRPRYAGPPLPRVPRQPPPDQRRRAEVVYVGEQAASQPSAVSYQPPAAGEQPTAVSQPPGEVSTPPLIPSEAQWVGNEPPAAIAQVMPDIGHESSIESAAPPAAIEERPPTTQPSPVAPVEPHTAAMQPLPVSPQPLPPNAPPLTMAKVTEGPELPAALPRQAAEAEPALPRLSADQPPETPSDVAGQQPASGPQQPTAGEPPPTPGVQPATPSSWLSAVRQRLQRLLPGRGARRSEEPEEREVAGGMAAESGEIRPPGHEVSGLEGSAGLTRLSPASDVIPNVAFGTGVQLSIPPRLSPAEERIAPVGEEVEAVMTVAGEPETGKGETFTLPLPPTMILSGSAAESEIGREGVIQSKQAAMQTPTAAETVAATLRHVAEEAAAVGQTQAVAESARSIEPTTVQGEELITASPQASQTVPPSAEGEQAIATLSAWPDRPAGDTPSWAAATRPIDVVPSGVQPVEAINVAAGQAEGETAAGPGSSSTSRPAVESGQQAISSQQPSTLATPTAVSTQRPEESADDTFVPAQPLPLEAVWPVERLDRPAFAPLAPAATPALRSSPLPPPVLRTAESDDQVHTILQGVASGQPSDSSIELIPPRRPRPAIIYTPPVQRSEGAAMADSGEPTGKENQVSVATPEIVETEIGPLPGDLWRLLGQNPPMTTERGPAIDRPVQPGGEPDMPLVRGQSRVAGLEDGVKSSEGLAAFQWVLPETKAEGLPETVTPPEGAYRRYEHGGSETVKYPGETALARPVVVTPIAPATNGKVQRHYDERLAAAIRAAEMPPLGSEVARPAVSDVVPARLQRQEGEAPAAEPTTEADSSAEPEEAESGSEVDVDELARQVYDEIKRRLAVEWERGRGRMV